MQVAVKLWKTLRNWNSLTSPAVSEFKTKNF